MVRERPSTLRDAHLKSSSLPWSSQSSSALPWDLFRRIRVSAILLAYTACYKAYLVRTVGHPPSYCGLEKDQLHVLSHVYLVYCSCIDSALRSKEIGNILISGMLRPEHLDAPRYWIPFPQSHRLRGHLESRAIHK